MSDFGRGYATCLIQFTFHGPRLAENVALYADMRQKEPALFSPANAVERWADGSSDHLYELIRPKRGLPVADWQAAKALSDRVLDIGHGYRPSSKSTPDECYRLLDEAERLLTNIGVADFDAALEWDTAHGLKPEAGSWSCRARMKTRPPVAAPKPGVEAGAPLPSPTASGHRGSSTPVSGAFEIKQLAAFERGWKIGDPVDW